MSLRATILAGLAILGIGLLAVWQFAPSVFAEARSLLEPKLLEMLVARAGLSGPVVIVTLMTIAVESWRSYLVRCRELMEQLNRASLHIRDVGYIVGEMRVFR